MYKRCHYAGDYEAMQSTFRRFGHHHYHKFNNSFWAKKFMKYSRSVPINIKETESAWEIEVFAPGYSREDIKLSVKDDILSIKGKAKEASKELKYQEFPHKLFEREIALNGKVIVAEISAKYKNGTLVITLPKTPEAQKPAQEIKIG